MKDIRALRPSVYFESDKSTSSVLRCITSSNAFDGLTTDQMKILTLPGGEVEIAIGGIQSSIFKNKYLISISPAIGGSVSVKLTNSDVYYHPVSFNDVVTQVGGCM